MKNSSRIFCALILVSSSILIRAANVTPSKNNEEVVLFDANKNDIKDIKNYTAKWKKGSDLTPQTELIEKNGEKWVKFTYFGQKRSAISRIDFKKDILSKLRQEKNVYEGIQLKIAYYGKDFEKFQVQAFFKDKTMLVNHLSLEKGIKEYSITKGFRRAKYPPDWDNLQYVWIANENPEMTFMLQKITMIEEKGKKKIKTLKITEERKTKEIFPSGTPILKDGKIDPECFNNAARLNNFHVYRKKEAMKESPLKARICYDAHNLAIETKAEFPVPPKANVKRHDDAVWQDEGIEFFFSPWLDNDKKIQFVTNMNGTCFDYVRDYDNVAARIINIIPWTLPHIKNLEYKDSVWKTEIAFPLNELKIDISKQRTTGFQLAQNYHSDKYKNEKYKTLSWTYTNKFPKPENFGLLIFNKKPFGPGGISIKEIQSFEKNEKLIDLTIKLSLQNFKPGNYKLKKKLSAPDFTVYNQEENLKLTEESSELSVKMTSIKNLNGTYSLYLCLYNENDDIKVAAVNFENSTPLKSMFGKKVFCPNPKKVIWKNGTFNAGDCNVLVIPEKASERTKKTAEIFAKQLCGFTGSKYKISESKESKIDSIELKIAKENLKKEGYSLKVDPKKVTITGADEAGLYYGCVTFMQLVKMPMKFQDNSPVQCVEILDWPDVQNRMMRLPHPWTFKGRKFKENRGIEFLMDWVERFVANNKYNRLWLDVSHLTKFKRRPEFNGPERIYSLEDLEKLGQFCRDRFIEIIPAFQVGGHANWWLLQYHPELREKGYKNMSDYTHPELNKIVFDCMLDIIEATKAKYATPKSDECWHKKHPDEIPDEKLRKKTRAQAFLDFHVALNNFLKKHGVKMIMYEDMLNPRHNGKRYDVYKVIDKFPKDIIIGQWGGASPDLTTEYFTSKGFKVWGNATNCWIYGEKGKKLANGFGVSAYGWGLYRKGLYRKNASYSAYIQFYGADLSWNMKRKNDPDLIDEIASGKLVALREMYALEPNPKASEKISPINIDNTLNSSWLKIIQKKFPDISLENLPSGKCNIGNIPTLLKTDNKNCAIMGNGATAEFPVKGKFSSLIFLHTGYVTPEGAKKFKVSWRKWIYGYPLGDYFVHYSDGTKEKLPVRLKRNIDWMDVNPLFRATVENRYVLPVKLSNGNYSFLYQWEWVNPHPEKEIEKVSYQDDKNFDFNLLLFAISGRKVRN